MLHPLSITAAKPREKIIYVNITPNNDAFNTNSDKINIYYFEGVCDPLGLYY